MTVPTEFFGGNSDGAMRMEDWLHEMCKGCRHGRTEDWGGGARVRGIGCELPARAYTDPYDDLPEWEVDVDDEFGEPFLRCTKKALRTRGRRRPATVGAGHPTLDLGGDA